MVTGGSHLYRFLEQRLPTALRKRYRDLHFEGSAGNAVHAIIPDLQPGARELVRLRIDEVGEAKVMGTPAFDIPIVDISAEEDRYKTLMVAAAFHIDFFEEEAYMMARTNGMYSPFINTTDERQRVARRAIAEKHNKIGAYGVSQLGVTGFLNNASVTLENSSFNPYSTDTTPDDVIDWVVSQIRSMYVNSNNIDMPADFLVSDDFMFYLKSRRVPDGDKSLLRYITDTLTEDDIPFSIKSTKEANSAMLEANGVHSSGTNKDRLVLYVNDAEVVERHFQMPRLIPEDYIEKRSGQKIFPLISCTTQTIINYTTAVRYIDIPKRP